MTTIAGARLKNLTLAGGAAIADDTSASYTIALPDYTWYGGTGHLSLVQAATSPPKVGVTLDDAVVAYLKDSSLTPGKDLVPATDGRITVGP